VTTFVLFLSIIHRVNYQISNSIKCDHNKYTVAHSLATATCLGWKHHDDQTGNTETKMKKRELWYTHCLVQHLTGARNTDCLAHPVVSRQSLTYNNTPVVVEESNIQSCCHVSIFAIFDTTPKRAVTTNKFFFDVFYQNILTSCTVDIHQLK